MIAPTAHPGGTESVWSQHVDDNTREVYYHNSLTQQSVWVKPPELCWSEYVDPQSGKIYFYNSETKETLWTKPSDEAVEPPLAPPPMQQREPPPLMQQQMSHPLPLQPTQQMSGQNGQHLDAAMTLQLALTFSHTGIEGSKERQVFVDTLKTDLATASAMNPAQFDVVKVSPVDIEGFVGNCTAVDLNFLSTSPEPKALIEIQQQSLNPSSKLLSGNVTKLLQVLRLYGPQTPPLIAQAPNPAPSSSSNAEIEAELLRLPPGWSFRHSQRGKYYVNKALNISQWTRPDLVGGDGVATAELSLGRAGIGRW